MKVLITGSHGLIGTALGTALESAGHEVVRLTRAAGPTSWDPARGRLDLSSLEGVDAAVNLAGTGIGDKRWTSSRKEEIAKSRTGSTDLLARGLAALDPKPSVLVSGSAVGIYGDRGDEVLDEDSPIGHGFLVGIAREWEEATAPASEAGIRVVHIRTGIVQSRSGGALKKQLPLFRFGLGGKLGSGRQYVSWITLEDEVGAIIHALTNASLAGPVNLTAPNPVTNAEYTRALGRALGRPSVLSVPSFALGLALGQQMTEEMLLASARVMPARLQASGFQFKHPDLPEALTSVLAG
jgi:uncharacterized protein (TIGR01777 family)